jgi:Holliday junction resolvase-like predicted endonuclease
VSLLIMHGWSFPRRQRYRRLRRAASRGAAALVACILAMIAAGAGRRAVAGALLLLTAGLLVDARHWARLAVRSRIGAESEDEVRHALAALEAEGWRVRHSLAYGGRGDIDSMAIAPTGIAFAIEVKTRSFERGHLAAVREMAVWLYRRRRLWCRRGALPVLCMVRARAVERIDDGVLIVSVERLVGALRTAAGAARRPGFVAADVSRR